MLIKPLLTLKPTALMHYHADYTVQAKFETVLDIDTELLDKLCEGWRERLKSLPVFQQ